MGLGELLWGLGLAAALLAAWHAGFREGSRSSKSSLEAAQATLSAASATSAMALNTATAASAVVETKELCARLEREMVLSREAAERLQELVRNEVMDEINASRTKRNLAVPDLERTPLPSIPTGRGRPLWGSTSDPPSPSTNG